MTNNWISCKDSLPPMLTESEWDTPRSLPVLVIIFDEIRIATLEQWAADIGQAGIVSIQKIGVGATMLHIGNHCQLCRKNNMHTEPSEARITALIIALAMSLSLLIAGSAEGLL